MVWNMIELCLGIMAASLPALKPLFNAFFQGTKTALGMSGSRSKTPSGYRKHGNSRDVDEMFHVNNVEFHEMRSHNSTRVSKNDILVTQEDEIDMVPKGVEAGRYDGNRGWR